MCKENIIAGVAVTGLLALVGLGAYTSAQEAEDFKRYKNAQLLMANFRNRIARASFENTRLTIDRRYEANKVLEYYQAKAEKATTRAEFETNFCKLDKLIRDFTCGDPDYILLSVMKATDQMREEIAAKERDEIEKRHLEELRQQRDNYERIANAIAGDR